MFLAHSPADTLSSLLLVVLWFIGDVLVVLAGAVGAVWILTTKVPLHRALLSAGCLGVFGLASLGWLWWCLREWLETWWLYALAAAPLALGLFIASVAVHGQRRGSGAVRIQERRP